MGTEQSWIISFCRELILDKPSSIVRLHPEQNSAMRKLISVGRQWGDSGLQTLVEEIRQKHLAQSIVAKLRCRAVQSVMKLQL